MLDIPYRESNGRACRAREPADSVALEARASRLGLTVFEAKNQLASTFIGRLHMQYQAWQARAGSDKPRRAESLSEVEYNAAVKFLDLYNDRLKVIQAEGARYDPRPRGSGDLEAHEVWGKDINKRYEAVRLAIQEAQNTIRSENLWAALDLCILRDQPLSHMVGALRMLCNAMARHWSIR